MSRQPLSGPSSEFVLWSAGRFLREQAAAYLLISIVLLVPCFWHARIQAGDLGSHVYNAWLAQLIERHQAPGLTLVRQWDNVLFDVLLLKAGNCFGLVAAEKIVISFAVLIFFWSCFAFLAELSGRLPWPLIPGVAMLAYGYVFHMGFMNFYLSLGLALFAAAASLRNGAGNWLLAMVVAALSLLAHPIGFLLFCGLTVYIRFWRILPAIGSRVLPAVVIAAFIFMGLYFSTHQALEASWRDVSVFQIFGHDQLNLFGTRYLIFSWVALGWMVLCGTAVGYDAVFRGVHPAAAFRLACELYFVSVIGTICLPENFRVSLYAGWVGLLVSRLTLVTAIFGLLTLATVRLPRWAVGGFVVGAAAFFIFLYQDTGKLDRMEESARAIAQKLPLGTRIVAVASPPDGWRVPFIYHSIERACIGHCFSFANYEASSLQFRVRAAAGNYYVSTSVDQADDMASGDYVVRRGDLPLTSFYQCDEQDFTQICALALREGQKTEDPESEPVAVPAEPEE